MSKGIAIVGGGATMKYAPLATDESWTCWTMNDFYDAIPALLQRPIKVGAVFEMHPPSHYTDHIEYRKDHEKRLAELRCKVYVAFPNPKIPNAMTYPIDEVLAYFDGPDYFCSTLPYMIAIAIMVIEKSAELADGVFAPRIGMFGCDMQLTSEYAKERACTEFWLGQAKARGIEVVVPDESPLLKSTYRYGYDTEKLSKVKKLIKGRHEELMTLRDQWARQEKVAHDMFIQYEASANETGWAQTNLTDDTIPPSAPMVAP